MNYGYPPEISLKDRLVNSIFTELVDLILMYGTYSAETK